jgi:ABC-2 type transport system ATP-binding protein
VKTLAERGKAILYSSHVLEVVEKLCTRVIVLHRGRAVADDSVARLRDLRATETLEDVFAQLVLREDPERTAREIADVLTVHA